MDIYENTSCAQSTFETQLSGIIEYHIMELILHPSILFKTLFADMRSTGIHVAFW